MHGCICNSQNQFIAWCSYSACRKKRRHKRLWNIYLNAVYFYSFLHKRKKSSFRDSSNVKTRFRQCEHGNVFERFRPGLWQKQIQILSILDQANFILKIFSIGPYLRGIRTMKEAIKFLKTLQCPRGLRSVLGMLPV